MSPQIKCHNLTFGYRDTPILSKVSFEIEHGEFLAFIGPNGSGKTTMLNLLMGFLTPQKGRLSFSQNTSIGYVPQSPHFDKAFPVSALNIVEMGLTQYYRPFVGIQKRGRKKAHEALERVGMEKYAERPFGTLSGGQAQKVLIARALVSEPNVLILDEPTANVDTESEQSIISLIEKLKGTQTILMVTHDFHTITQYVDRVLLFQKKVISLKPEELCNHYAIGVYHPPRKDRS